MEIEKEKLEKLLKAKIMLMTSASIIYNSASGVEPFRASKFLNVLGKELFQLSMELRVLLGSSFEKEWDFEKMSSLQILKAMYEDDELVEGEAK